MTKVPQNHLGMSNNGLVKMSGREAIDSLKQDWLDFCDTGVPFSVWAGDVLPIFETDPNVIYEFYGEVTCHSIRRVP